MLFWLPCFLKSILDNCTCLKRFLSTSDKLSYSHTFPRTTRSPMQAPNLLRRQYTQFRVRLKQGTIFSRYLERQKANVMACKERWVPVTCFLTPQVNKSFILEGFLLARYCTDNKCFNLIVVWKVVYILKWKSLQIVVRKSSRSVDKIYFQILISQTVGQYYEETSKQKECRGWKDAK